MPNIELIKRLREATDLPFSQIKKAIDMVGEDEEKIIQFLKDQGALTAIKKASRTTNEGIVISYIHNNGKIGVLLQLLCETDFVAINPVFKELGHNVSMHIAAMNPENIEECISQIYIKDQSITIGQLIENAIAKLGENIKIERFIRFSI